MESPIHPFKVFHSADAIDLTGDDSPVPSTILGPIDLTDEPALEERLEVGLTQTSNSHPIEFSDSEAESDLDNIEDSASSNSSESLGSLDSDDSEDVDMLGEIDSGSEAEDMDMTAEEALYMEDLSTTNMPICGNSLTNEGLRKIADLMDDDDDDDDSEFGLSEAGAEGLRALFETTQTLDVENPEPVANTAPQLNEVASMKSQGTLKLPSKWIPADLVPFPVPPPLIIRRVGGAENLEKVGQPSTTNIPSASVAIDRQPSPSDAAMVKTAPVQATEAASGSVPVFQQPNLSFGQLAQTLGDKTGKHAFFEAREKNKAQVTTNWSGSTEHISSVVPRPDDYMPLSYKRKSAPFEQCKPGPQNLFCLLLLNHIARFPGLNTIERAASPEYDMTSAVKFNESKAKAVRSRLSIHDIIENSLSPESPPQLEARSGEKRKASEISDIQEEVRAWATSPDIAVAKPQQTQQAQRSTLASEGRPMKKLKTLMNRAAYVAAGGAVLFFGLVATAPDFS
jgi:hypothetical protein